MWSNLMLQKKQRDICVTILVIIRNEQIPCCIMCPNDRMEAMLNLHGWQQQIQHGSVDFR